MADCQAIGAFRASFLFFCSSGTVGASQSETRRIAASSPNFSDCSILFDFIFGIRFVFVMASGIRVGCQVRVIGGTTHIGKQGVIKRITAKMCWITSTCQPDPFRVILSNLILDSDDTASEAVIAAETLEEVKVELQLLQTRVDELMLLLEKLTVSK